MIAVIIMYCKLRRMVKYKQIKPNFLCILL